MKDKNKILILSDWFSPGFRAGGPIRSVSNFVRHFNNDFHLSVFTRDRDYRSKIPYEGIKADCWTRDNDGVSIYYVSQKNLNWATLKNILFNSSYDAFFLNSFFSFYFTILPLFLIRLRKYKGKVILAPRGMLLEKALSHKPLKKRIYIRLAKLLKLYEGVVWAVTAEGEESAVKKLFGSNQLVAYLPNLPPIIPSGPAAKKKEKGAVRLIFNSRVVRHKNLLKIISWLSSLGAAGEVQLDIYGLIEDRKYWQECQKKVEKLPERVKVAYKGVLEHNCLVESLGAYHFMVLPTEGENFGYSILEAMSAGCPVIISDRTNWRGLEPAGAGWDLPLEDEGGFIEVIRKTIDMSQEEYDRLSNSAHQYALCTSKNLLTKYKSIKEVFE